jgi:hypothetical protein
MDTSDPNIRFDDAGRCDYCINFETNLRPAWEADVADPSRIARVAESIRTARKGREFDCIIGLSGGLDSSYTAYVAKEIMGLRPLLFHVDAGWNTDQAVGNIEKLVNGLGLDLYTEVVDWEEMKDLQVAVSLRSKEPHYACLDRRQLLHGVLPRTRGMGRISRHRRTFVSRHSSPLRKTTAEQIPLG